MNDNKLNNIIDSLDPDKLKCKITKNWIKKNN